MKYGFSALALLALGAPVWADDEVPVPRQSTIRAQRPVQAPPVIIVVKRTYAQGCAEALKTGKTLLVGVGCPCPNMANCISCETDALEGFRVGVHVATVSDGKLYCVGMLGAVSSGASEFGGFSAAGGGCAGGSCGTSAPARGIFRRR